MTHLDTIDKLVEHHSRTQPTAAAFVEGASGTTLTWAEYHDQANHFAEVLATKYAARSRLGLQFAHEIDMHVAMLACERAGLVAVGIGSKAGRQEREHLLRVTDAVDMVDTVDTFSHHAPPGQTVGIDRDSKTKPRHRDLRPRLDPFELSFLNSTSGTTGLPKCVMHNQRRWFAFHELAVTTAHLTSTDVMMSLLPAPFGFGLWTAHFTPTILGIPCIVFDRFDARVAARALTTYQATVLAAVSTQFVMMLNTEIFSTHAPPALRVLFTGGEMVPPTRAREWETVTKSLVLQFYGSNETGALSATSLDDDEHVRLHTAGHVIDQFQVRLLHPDTGIDVTETGGPGIAACKGEVNCLGYYNDPDADRELFTTDGWMKTGDLCTIDSEGLLTVAGRASDFIIRGGKNISAAVVEQNCATFPGVLLAAAVAKSDATFGERVCVFVAVAPNTAPFVLHDLVQHLELQGLGKEHWPEYLVIVDGDLPRSSGGKVAKAVLREQARGIPSISITSKSPHFIE